MRVTLAVIALAVATALLAACGSDSMDPSGAGGTGHRYAIDLTSNATSGSLCQWSESDQGSMVVTMTPATLTGTVTNVTNNRAQLVESPCSSPCTETVLSMPNGPIDIETISAVTENPGNEQVTVSYESTVEAPTFRDVCGTSITTVVGGPSTVRTYIQFFDNGVSQDVSYVDPATGLTAHMVVTPMAQ